MKFDLVKSLLAVALSAVLALICYKLGMEEGSRNWIAFIFTFFGAVVLLLPALGMDWSAYGGRGITVKVFAWVALVLQFVTDLLFSIFEFDTGWFAIVVSLELIVSVIIIYLVAKSGAPRK